MHHHLYAVTTDGTGFCQARITTVRFGVSSLKKLRVPPWAWLSVSEYRIILGSLVLTQYQHVTVRQTDTPVPPIAKSRSTTAERNKNGSEF